MPCSSTGNWRAEAGGSPSRPACATTSSSCAAGSTGRRCRPTSRPRSSGSGSWPATSPRINWKAYPNDFNNVGPRVVGFAWESEERRTDGAARGATVCSSTMIFGRTTRATSSPTTRARSRSSMANDVRVTGIPNTFFPEHAAGLAAERTGEHGGPGAQPGGPVAGDAAGQRRRDSGSSARTCPCSADFIHVLGLHFRRRGQRATPGVPMGPTRC